MSHKEPTHDWLPADIDKMSDLLPIIGAPGFQVCLAPDPPKKTKGRATSIVGPGVSQSKVYNGLDTRVGSTTNSVGRTFLRDGAYVTDPVLSDGAATYTPGVSERRGAATTFLHSGLKNADAQSGAAQTVAASRQYDAFGNLLTSTGTWNGPFGYAGSFGYQEDATGLKLLGHRYYDSSTGRFLTRDPIYDGRNWYVYCDGDPIRYLDPTGLLRVFDMEFTWEGTKDGLTTGVHGLASGMTFGLYDGGDHKNDPGFGFSKGAGTVASVALIAAAALEVGGANVVFRGYPNSGGGGAQHILKGKPTPWRIDIHPWKGQPPYKWPHYHRPPKPGMQGKPGEGVGRHRPWEGW